MDQQIDHIISELNDLKETLNDSIEKKRDDDSSTNQPKPIRRRQNRSFQLNRSKYLNEEQ